MAACQATSSTWGLFSILPCCSQVGWNKFDLFLVVLALVDAFTTSVQLSFLRVLRLLRMTRVVHLARAAGMVRLVKMATVRGWVCLFWGRGALLHNKLQVHFPLAILSTNNRTALDQLATHDSQENGTAWFPALLYRRLWDLWLTLGLQLCQPLEALAR
jgi:hypothetical protein